MIIDQKNFQPLLYKSADKRKMMKFKILVPILWKSKKSFFWDQITIEKCFSTLFPFTKLRISILYSFLGVFSKNHIFFKNMIFCKKIVYKSCTDPWQDKNSFLNLPINDSQLSLHVSIILRSLEDFLCSQSITIWPQTKFNTHLDQTEIWDPSLSNLKFSTQDPTYFLQILYDSFLRLNFM